MVEQVQEIMAGGGYSSQDSYTVSFGTGNSSTIDSLKIIWPSGLVQYHYDITSNMTYNILEGCQIPGDLNNDIIVDILDIVQIVNYILDN